MADRRPLGQQLARGHALAEDGCRDRPPHAVRLQNDEGPAQRERLAHELLGREVVA